MFLFAFLFFAEISRLQSSKLPPASSPSPAPMHGSSHSSSSHHQSSSNYRDPIKYVDVYRERPIRLTVRVLVPVREHPKVISRPVDRDRRKRRESV